MISLDLALKHVHDTGLESVNRLQTQGPTAVFAGPHRVSLLRFIDLRPRMAVCDSVLLYAASGVGGEQCHGGGHGPDERKRDICGRGGG